MVKGNHTAPVLRRLVPNLVSLGVLAGLFSTSIAAAEDVPHEGTRAMPAILGVGVPVAPTGPVTLAGSAGYGIIDPAYDLQSSGHRLNGQIAGSFQVLPNLVIGGDSFGRMDFFSSDDDDQLNAYGEPRLAGRFFMPASDTLHWGIEADLRFVGEDAPDINASALSPSFRGLVGSKLSETTWLAGQLGLHLDNSANALPSPESVSSADRVTVGAGTAPAIQFGIGASHRLAGGTELLGEIGGEFLFGSVAPSLVESPWGMALGARHPLSKNLDVMLSGDVSFSARPAFDPDILVPIEPRVGVAVSAVWRFGVPDQVAIEVEEKPDEVKEEAPKEETPKESEVKTSPVSGSVVDEGGRPLADVAVTLTREGAEPVEERTFANGAFEFKDVPDGPVSLVIKTPGFDEAKVEFKEGEERTKEVVLYPALPAGQVKGEVRDLKGNPIEATIKVTPGDKEIQVGSDGHFELELAPGRYTVRFEAPDHSPQKRFIRVVDRGVVVLNIALTK